MYRMLSTDDFGKLPRPEETQLPEAEQTQLAKVERSHPPVLDGQFKELTAAVERVNQRLDAIELRMLAGPSALLPVLPRQINALVLDE